MTSTVSVQAAHCATSVFQFSCRLARLLSVAVLALAASAKAQEVLPDFYKEPGISPNRAYVNQNFNEHIDPFTGSLQLHYADLHLPGNGGFDLSVVRSYNSGSVDTLNPATYDGLAGLGWTVHFGRVLRKNANACAAPNISVANNPVLETQDGGRHLFAFTGFTSPLALTTQRWRADCISSGSSGLAVYSPDGTRYDMTQRVNASVGTATMFAWYTTLITDRNGNTATISYAAVDSPQISSVVTSDGRRIDFTYLDSGLASRRISSISAAGQTYNYGYAAVSGVLGKFQLTTVTRPDGYSWDYTYNSSLNGAAGGYLLNQVRYPEGAAVSYSYGDVYFDTQANPGSRSSVVRTKTLDSGGNWTFTYAPGAPNVYDTTTVTTPSGAVIYRHIGPNYTQSGTVWMVGLLVSREVGSAMRETNTWGKQKISTQNNFRPGAFVLKVDTGEVNAPILTSREIVRDGATYTTNYGSFDGYGNPGTISESGPNGGGRTRSLTYNVNTTKWIVKQVKDDTVSGGTSIARSIDGAGNVLAVVRDGVSTSYNHDGEGNVSLATFPRNLQHNYSRYRRGIAQSESQPEAINITRVVSDAGNVTSYTNGEQKTTTYTYDGLNRLTGIRPPAGSATSIAYATGKTASKTASRGALQETTDYDGYGRPISIALGGITRTYGYDALNRMTFASNPGSSAGTTYTYDVLDRIHRITNADNSYRDISYGAGSKTVVDERRNSTTYTYRSYGDPAYELLMSVATPITDANVSIARNGRDLVTSMTQAGMTRQLNYNGAGYLTSAVNPETGTTTYGRDATGNMTSRAVGTSGETTYAYDGQNRLSNVTYPTSTGSAKHGYTRTGKLKSVASSAVSRGYSYDDNDNLVGEAVIVDGLTFSLAYGYNGLDQMSSITYPRSGRTVTYAPNALGRPTQVSGFAAAITYWPSGLLQQINYANGVVSTYGQSGTRLWPTAFATRYNGVAFIDSSYVYDGAGNLTYAKDAADTYYNRGFAYDALNRLTVADGPWGNGSIAYNGAGNITSHNLGSSSLSYSYSSQNRLTNVSGSRSGSFAYDANGNITSGPDAAYTYDGASNLTCVNCVDAARSTAYSYDALNRRVVVTKGTVKTYEIYGFNGNLLVEYTPSLGGKLMEYFYLGGRRIAQVQTGGPIDPRPSTTTVSAAPSPAGLGQIVELRVSIVGNNPSGTVNLLDGSTVLGTAFVSGGLASLPVTFNAIGTRSITARYSGDAANLASTSTPVAVTVNEKATTTTTLSVSPSSALTTQTIALVATVTGNNPGGNAVFRDGTTALGTAPLSDGRASLNMTFPTAGSKSISASYEGDSRNAASVSTAVALSVAVDTRAASTTQLSGATSAAMGSTQQYSMYVNPNGGYVVLRLNGQVVGEGNTVLLYSCPRAPKGQPQPSCKPQPPPLTIPVTFASTGTHTLIADFAGDATSQPSRATLVVTVSP